MPNNISEKAITEKQAPPRALPGDPTNKDMTDSMMRVDHAGEFGAVRIYKGQLAILGDNHPKSAMIRHMLAQEERHLDQFNKMMTVRQVRPTALTPLWNVAGFALGAGTALMGEKAAMACTAAVEEVIDEHYQDQLNQLDPDSPSPLAGTEKPLAAAIHEFQAEEIEHMKIAKKHGAEEALGYPLLSGIIKAGCHAAIWLSKRV